MTTFSFSQKFRVPPHVMYEALTDERSNLFGDPNYAWELLDREIALELCEVASGDLIANLLELYMKGVEKMNSVSDLRESYFKNKVTALMSRQNVIRSLGGGGAAKPMAKKNVSEVINLAEKKPVNGKPQTVTPPAVNTLLLNEKKKEIQMRLAHNAIDTTPDSVSKIINSEAEKIVKVQKKIKQLADSHESALQQRIKKRKLKTATYKAMSEAQNDAFRSGFMNDFGGEINYDGGIIVSVPIGNKLMGDSSPGVKTETKRSRSHEPFKTPSESERKKKQRRFTFDEGSAGLLPDGSKKNISATKVKVPNDWKYGSIKIIAEQVGKSSTSQIEQPLTNQQSEKPPSLTQLPNEV